MKKMLIIGLVLVFGLAMVGCPTEDDNGGNDNGGSGNGGGGGGSGIVPNDLRGTWTRGGWSYTFTADTVVSGWDYKTNASPGEWRIYTYEVTNCTAQINNAASTRDEYPNGYRLSLKATKIEFGDYFSADEVPAVGSTNTYTVHLNTAKTQLIFGESSAEYLKN